MTKNNSLPKDKDVHDKTIKDTGERMVPAYHKSHMVYGEHIVRYEAAMQLVSGLNVLDIASGTGYGSALLSKSAKTVVGVDISKQAISYSKKNYASKKVTFAVGSCTDIPLADGSVDAVVSFETIEHIADYQKFMSEIKRVLRDDGLLILSTPNDSEFPETNEYHEHEFTQTELMQLLKKHFIYIDNYYQVSWLYTGLMTKENIGSEWSSNIETINAAPVSAERATYFFMVCSNHKINNTLKPIAAISESWSERKIQEYEQSVRKLIEEQGAIIRHLKNENDRLANARHGATMVLRKVKTRIVKARGRDQHKISK